MPAQWVEQFVAKPAAAVVVLGIGVERPIEVVESLAQRVEQQWAPKWAGRVRFEPGIGWLVAVAEVAIDEAAAAAGVEAGLDQVGLEGSSEVELLDQVVRVDQVDRTFAASFASAHLGIAYQEQIDHRSQE